MDKTVELKLNFEPVPDSCWYSNLRTLLKPSVWDAIRKRAYAEANGRCSICKRAVKRLEAHEVWSYDIGKETQKLEKVIAVCHDCHSVIHIGRTQLMGDEDRAIAHFMKVNDCTFADYIKALGKANALNNERNKVGEWKLDLTLLERILNDL